MPSEYVAAACGSRSMSSTRRPRTASSAPRLTVVVVLPTPPFWLAMAMMRVLCPGLVLSWVTASNPLRGRAVPLALDRGQQVESAAQAVGMKLQQIMIMLDQDAADLDQVQAGFLQHEHPFQQFEIGRRIEARALVVVLDTLRGAALPLHMQIQLLLDIAQHPGGGILAPIGEQGEGLFRAIDAIAHAVDIP